MFDITAKDIKQWASEYDVGILEAKQILMTDAAHRLLVEIDSDIEINGDTDLLSIIQKQNKIILYLLEKQ